MIGTDRKQQYEELDKIVTREDITWEEYYQQFGMDRVEFWSSYWATETTVLHAFEEGIINFRELQGLLGLRFVKSET